MRWCYIKEILYRALVLLLITLFLYTSGLLAAFSHVPGILVTLITSIWCTIQSISCFKSSWFILFKTYNYNPSNTRKLTVFGINEQFDQESKYAESRISLNIFSQILQYPADAAVVADLNLEKLSVSAEKFVHISLIILALKIRAQQLLIRQVKTFF